VPHPYVEFAKFGTWQASLPITEALLREKFVRKEHDTGDLCHNSGTKPIVWRHAFYQSNIPLDKIWIGNAVFSLPKQWLIDRLDNGDTGGLDFTLFQEWQDYIIFPKMRLQPRGLRGYLQFKKIKVK